MDCWMPLLHFTNYGHNLLQCKICGDNVFSQAFDILMNPVDCKQKATKMKTNDCTKGERKLMHSLRLELGTIKEFTYSLHHLSDNLCIFIVLY